MKILLFVAPGGYFAERWSQGSTMPTLGLLYIGAVLEKEGIDVRIVPADVLGLDWRGIRDMIRAERPDVVGVTSTTENRFQSFKLVRIARKALPGVLTVMGGPHASMASADTLSHIPELDVVVRGEGEVTTLELCRAVEKAGGDRPSLRARLAAIDGISYRDAEGNVVATRPRAPIADLDSLPFPAFHLIPFDKYNFTIDVPGHGPLQAVNIMASRGCPFDCNFCATPINWGRHVRMRSPENVVDEIEKHVRERGVRVVFFYDDTFNASPKRVERICDLILERRLDIFWRAEVRLDLITRPLLEKMKKAGLFHISFGIEAGSERVRREVIHKLVDIGDFHNLVRWCLELGVVPNVFFIFSHPTETWEEARETVGIIEKYRKEVEASVAVLHVYPGTPLEATAKELGLLPKDFTWTKKYGSRVITLPSAQGDVPLFLDKLTWSQVSELLFRWAMSGGNVSIVRKTLRAVRHIRSFGDLKRYAVMAWVLAKLKAGRSPGRNAG
jgi:anaerobic magnesium-protoporphyrin IX monomethyl ester cyclase